MEQKLTPYEGEKPYAFISYSHKDSEKVFEILERLQRAGLKFWYDAGIEGGSKYRNYIAKKIRNCHCLIVFNSQNSKESDYCQEEINFARTKEIKKDILPIYLESVELDDGIQMALGMFQAINFYEYADKEIFYSTLLNLKLLQPCISVENPVKKIKKFVPQIKNVISTNFKQQPNFNLPNIEILKTLTNKILPALLSEDKTAERKIIPIILILDTSGSMADKPIKKLNKAVRKMIKNLSANIKENLSYQLAAVTFDSEAKIFLPYTSVENISDLPQLQASGGTALGAALTLAKNLIENETPENWQNPIIILAIDGFPVDDYEKPLQDFISGGRSEKSLRIAVGIGENFDKEILKSFATKKNLRIKIKSAADIVDTFNLITAMIINNI